MLKYKKILLFVSGSISAYKSLDLISNLKKYHIEVDVMITKSTLNFIGKASFEGMSGNRVLEDLFEDGKMMDHIHLTREYDLFLVYPASANLIAKIAQGISDDLTSATILALNYKKPLWIAPAMNTGMWDNPATQRNIDLLKKDGAQILGPRSGRLACGDVGSGRLIEVRDVLKEMRDESSSRIRSN